jgi:aurora kinase
MKGFNYDNIKNTINAYKTRNKSRVETRNTVIQGFEFGKVLGRGKFGEVYMAKHVDTGFIVAIKKVGKKILKEFKMIDQFVKEIKLHSKLDHPNIVRFYGFFEETDNIYLVLEYISGGTLFDFQN